MHHITTIHDPFNTQNNKISIPWQKSSQALNDWCFSHRYLPHWTPRTTKFRFHDNRLRKLRTIGVFPIDIYPIERPEQQNFDPITTIFAISEQLVFLQTICTPFQPHVMLSLIILIPWIYLFAHCILTTISDLCI